MVKIEFAEFKYKYRYLWLKYITGINLSKHCAKCLLGEYEPNIFQGLTGVRDLPLPKVKYYYLCGVTSKWANNLHIAFREKEGSVIEIDDKHVKCRITNAERLPITDKYIDPTLAHAEEKAYNTCRNWWFANYISAEESKKIEFEY